MTKSNGSPDLDRLRAVLDIYGGNAEVWPSADAMRLARVAKATPVARALVREAEALDRVLAAAPAGNLDRMAGLTDRIMERTASARPALVGSAKIVPLPVRARSQRVGAVARPRYLVPVFGALAASLAIGFYVGTSSLVMPALQQVAGLTQDSADTAGATVQPALDDGAEGELL